MIFNIQQVEWTEVNLSLSPFELLEVPVLVEPGLSCGNVKVCF